MSILPTLSIVSWVIPVSVLYIFTKLSDSQLMKAHFYFFKKSFENNCIKFVTLANLSGRRVLCCVFLVRELSSVLER